MSRSAFTTVQASWVWGVVLGAALVIRYAFDTLVPVTDYLLRASILTYTIFGVCLFAGFSMAWRTRSVRAGVLATCGAATIGAVLSIVAAAVLLAIWHDPATLNAWRNSGGLDEAFIDVPLKLVAVGAVIGTVGALVGKGAVHVILRSSAKVRT